VSAALPGHTRSAGHAIGAVEPAARRPAERARNLESRVRRARAYKSRTAGSSRTTVDDVGRELIAARSGGHLVRVTVSGAFAFFSLLSHHSLR
jgi:hypothetical protein